MKKFFLEQSDDKKYHLFVWDSATGKISHIAQSDEVKELGYKCYIIRKNKSQYQLFTCYNNMIRKVIVPNANVERYLGYFIWKNKDVWYLYDSKTEQTEILGDQRFEAQISLGIRAWLEIPSWPYFMVKQDDGTFNLTFITGKGIYRCGPYKKVKQGYADNFIAYKDDMFCDVYVPYPPYILAPKSDEDKFNAFICPHNAFYWKDKTNDWFCIEGGRALANNAFQEHYLIENVPYARLYELVGTEKKLIAEGKLQVNKCNGKIATCIDGVCYLRQGNKIDFANPKMIFSRKVKKFFTGK